MIHSLAGGILSENAHVTLAKVEILNDYFAGTFWYVAKQKVKEGNVVLVPVGKQNILQKGKVLKVLKNVSPQASPIPIKHTKEIVSVES